MAEHDTAQASRQDTLQRLDELLTALADARLNFVEASSQVGAGPLGALLDEYADDCARALHALQKGAQSLGEPRAGGGSVGGVVRKGWIKLKSALGADAELAAIEEAEQEHQRVIAAFDAAMQAGPPPAMRAALAEEGQRLLRWTQSIQRLRHAR